MRLYRSIGEEELLTLLKNGKVSGQFDRHNKDSSYNVKLGKVCPFLKDKLYLDSNLYDFFIEIEINPSQIIGEGEGNYTLYTVYDESSKTHLKELYLKEYSLKDIVDMSVIEYYDGWEENYDKINKNFPNYLKSLKECDARSLHNLLMCNYFQNDQKGDKQWIIKNYIYC